MPPPAPLPGDLPRRSVLIALAAAGGAALAGCTFGSRPEAQEPGRRTTADGETAAEPDPDVALAVEALAGERAALLAVEATGKRHRELRRPLSGLVEGHRAHVALLASAAPDEALPRASRRNNATQRYQVPDSPRAASRKLVLLEQSLSGAAKRHAFTAHSGAFARLLASMAAAAAQQAAELESTVVSRGSGGSGSFS